MKKWLSPHYLQQEEWSRVRKEYDWDSIVVEVSNQPIRLYFRTVLGLGTFSYTPLCAPILNEKDLEKLKEKANKVLPDDTFCLKIEPEQTETGLETTNELVKAKKSIQFEATVRVDLTRSENEIMSSFEKGTRYNVRKSLKRGVEVSEVEASDENLEKLYGFKELTGKRGGHYLRPKSFLMKFWKESAKEGKGHLFFAKHEEDLLAALFVITDGVRAWNKDSGSTRKKRSLAAPAGMHWEAMKFLKEKGIREYDFSGVSPKEQRESEDNPMRGVDKFKTGFADPIDYVGAHDLVLNGSKYRLWQKIESIYIRLYHRLKGLYWY